ncbi:MAG: mechanosensitive ion channel protein MscS [Desulfobulbaceae bacterium]|nr:MAG: mechanosensitive ion channel protein MscS [Desulfobulbaceae bacterium]
MILAWLNSGVLEKTMSDELSTLQNLYQVAAEFLVTYSFQIIGALIILLVGLKLASWASGFTSRLCEKHGLDITLSRFIGNVSKIVVLTFVVIIAIGKFGISIAPFIAAVSALAFGASFAIQGPLSNYGAGLSIILSRPFVVGNTITISGVSGVVEEIRLAATILSTEDGEEILIPNKHIVGEILKNSFANKIIEAAVGISYGDDPAPAISAIKTILADHPHVCDDPAPQVGIAEFADSAITIAYRCWVPTKEYFQIRYQINGAIHQAFQEKGITIPFPQRDIHLIKENQ